MSRKRSGSPISLFSFQDAITSVCGVVVLVTLLLALDLARRAQTEAATQTASRERVEETRKEIETLRNNLAEVQASADFSAEVDAAGIGMSLQEARQELNAARRRLDEAQKERDALDEDLERLTAELAEARQDAKETEAILERAQEARKTAAKTVAKKVDLQKKSVYSYPDPVEEQPWFVDISGERIIAYSQAEPQGRRFETAFSFANFARTRPRNKEYFVLVARPSGAKAASDIQMELDDDHYRYGVDLIGERRELVFICSGESETNDEP